MAGFELTVKIPYNPRSPQPEIHKIMDENKFSVIVAHRRLGKTVCTINQLIKKALLDTSGNGRYGYIAANLTAIYPWL